MFNIFGSKKEEKKETKKPIQRCADGSCYEHATSKYSGKFYCPLHLGQIYAKDNSKDQEVQICSKDGCNKEGTSKYSGKFYCPLHLGQIYAKDNSKDQEVQICSKDGCNKEGTSKYSGKFYCELHVGQIFGQPTEKEDHKESNTLSHRKNKVRRIKTGRKMSIHGQHLKSGVRHALGHVNEAGESFVFRVHGFSLDVLYSKLEEFSDGQIEIIEYEDRIYGITESIDRAFSVCGKKTKYSGNFKDIKFVKWCMYGDEHSSIAPCPSCKIQLNIDIYRLDNIIVCSMCRGRFIATKNKDKIVLNIVEKNANKTGFSESNMKNWTGDNNMEILNKLFEYEKNCLTVIKEFKEEIKFASSLQEDVRKERTSFFSKDFGDISKNLKESQVDDETAAAWLKELVNSYTKSLDLSSDLAKTHMLDLVGIIRSNIKENLTKENNEKDE